VDRGDSVEHQRDELGLDFGRHRPDFEGVVIPYPVGLIHSF